MLYRTIKCVLASALLLIMSLANSVQSKENSLQSAGALTFGSENVLFVGDNVAGVVHAFAFNEKAFDSQDNYVLGRAPSFEGRTIIDNLTYTHSRPQAFLKESGLTDTIHYGEFDLDWHF